MFMAVLNIVKLNWIMRDSSTLFNEIERKKNMGDNFMISKIDSISEFYFDSGIESCNTYFYRIRSFDGNYNSEYLNKVTVLVNN